MQTQSEEYDCALGKEELRRVYITLLEPHLKQNNKNDIDFDAWYSQLEKWNRTMVYASQLKKYL
jgi:hypothetical protein